MSWPTLPASSSNSFLDHFSGSSLSSRWTSITSGTGAVTVTDSYVQMDQPASSASSIYYNTQLDKTKSQLWQVAFSQSVLNTGGFAPRFLSIVNGASAPVADTKSNYDAKAVIERLWADGSHYAVNYYDNAAANKRWSGTTGSQAWIAGGGGTGTDSDAVGRADDYYVLGLEFDAQNQRWRTMAWGQTFATAGTYTFDQGWRLFALSDWVTWALTRSNTNLWLMLGWAANDNAVANQVRVEWVRYCEAQPGNALLDGWAAANSGAGTSPQIRHVYSHDGTVFVPEDRASWALALGAGTADNLSVGEPFVVYDGSSTDYMFYDSGGTGAPRITISVASAPHTTPQNGPWTRFGSNPIIVNGGSGADDEHDLVMPWVVCDPTEPNSAKRWKMLYSAKKVSDSKWRTLYATASTPTGTWTKQGTVLNVGAGGADDENAARDVTVVSYGGQWEMYYEGWDASGVGALMRATASDIGGPWTKTGTIIKMVAGGTRQSLTANLNTAPGRTVTVADTTGFQVDAAVVLSQSTTLTTWSYSKIRKIVSGTVLELYHGLTGLTTYPAKIKQIDTGPNLSPRVIAQVGSEWWFYIVRWEPWQSSSDAASYASTLEEIHLYKHSNAAPSGTTPLIQYQPSPVISRGFNVDLVSFENMCVRNDPFPGFITPSIIAIHGNVW